LRGARDKLSVGTGPTSLKFGTYELEAWHPLLGSQVKEFTIDPLNVQTHRWELDYGAVDILTGQDGLKVKLFPQDSAVAARLSEFAGGNDWPREDFTTMWRTPITNAFLPPGKYRIEFTDDEQKAEREFEVARRVSPGEPPARHQFTDVAFLPATFQSSLGITLSKLVGQSTYISLVRLTRGQFNQIMDASLPETAYSDRPVVTRDEQ
ncbi:MAG TPA: hypothetical protein DCY13_17785, partial [Verrucomicrobiales bacterium]|nr:hypothetical protein [Verrucomicrobiales bacterium]